jgi:replicative DNA helicase
MTQEGSAQKSIALPHAPATEASILASGLMDSRYWPLAESLDPDVQALFYEPDHHRIAAAMHRLYQAGRVITEDAVVDALRSSGDELEGGTRETLLAVGMRASARNQAEFKDQIAALSEKRSLRRIATGSSKVSERARGGETTAVALAEEILSVAEHGRSAGEPIKRFGEHLDTMDSVVSYRVPTNLPALNDLIGGWESGRIYAVAARPKVGKTALGLNSVVHALASDAVVLMFSLEMSRKELWGRLLSCTAFLPQNDVQQYLNNEKSIDDFPAEQRENLEKSIEDIKNSDLYIVEGGEVRAGIHDVMATVMDVKSRYPADKPFVVFIDYLQLMVSSAFDSVSEITDITRELKLLAARADIPIVLMSQINRGGADNDSGMPNPHQMRGSGSIEQDADVTILLNRKFLQDEEHSEYDMDVWVALSRYSRTGWIKAYYATEHQTIEDVVSPSQAGGYNYDVDSERSSSRPSGASTRSAAPDELGDDEKDPDFEAYADEFGV